MASPYIHSKDLTLVMIGGGAGGALCAVFYFFFLLKISPTDQILRPICKFLILGIFYHAKKKISKFSM